MALPPGPYPTNLEAFPVEIDINLFHQLFRAHPWHGVHIGDQAPELVTAFIEIVPSDTVKYELDKPTGHLKVDRPQKFSNVYPTLYGLIPQTYCGERIAEFCMTQASRKGIVGDGDPLDVCVLAEKSITHGDILLPVTPIGGLRMIDDNEADDKIIAVPASAVDPFYDGILTISDLPAAKVQQIETFFRVYKQSQDGTTPVVLDGFGDAGEARELVEAALESYTPQTR